MIHVFGDDPDGAELLAQLKARIGDADLQQLNITTFDGQRLVVEDLVSACEAVPFLAESRLVIVRGFLSRLEPRATAQSSSRMTDKQPSVGTKTAREQMVSDEPEAKVPQAVAELAAYVGRLPRSTDLAFVERTPISKQNPLYKPVMAAGARIMQTVKLQGGDLAAWIDRRVQAKGSRLAPGASALLASYAFNDLWELDRELDKLVCYAGSEAIDTKAIRQVATAAREANIYKMADALASGDSNVAFDRLQVLLAEGESPQYILSMVVRQFRLLVQIKDLQNRGLPVDAIAAKLHLQSFVVERLTKQLRRYPRFEQLKEVYEKLLVADRAAKSGGRELTLSLDLLTAELSTRLRPYS